MKRLILIPILLLLAQYGADAQQVLTLEDCRQMAVQGNKNLDQARQKVKMAEYDRKIAAANYFPEIKATGAYLYNNKNLVLIDDQTSDALNNMGTTVQGQFNAQMEQLMAAIKTNPSAAMEYMKSPMWQTVVGALSQTDVSAALNTVGSSISESFNLDIQNVYVGAVSLQQPVFVGGKIVASNRMAKYADELARVQYEGEYEDVLLTVDQAYWQIVSIANKKKLAEDYAALLDHLCKDVEVSVAEGVATQSDLLSIKVKCNEAQMLLSKSVNGLALSKMLLCKQIGLPLDSEITLADETLDVIPMPELLGRKDMDSILADRTETRSLDLASKIYDQKVTIARADGLPTVALTANYLISNPSSFNGFKNEFGASIHAGVLVSVPLFHGTEGIQKTKKAKAEAEMYRTKYQDACEMIGLQVEQLTRQQDEAFERVNMTESSLESAEENLRVAMLGFEEGVVSASVTLQAQTAWMQAHSEYIDACVELQMNHANLLKAQGEYNLNN